MSEKASHYQYNPSTALAIVGAITFTLVTLISTFRAYQIGARVIAAFLIGVYLEAGGHIARAISIQNPTENNSYLIAYLVPVIAPSFLAAGMYVVFGRTLTLVTPKSKLNFRTLWISPRWIAPIFITVDIISFLIQLVGVMGVAAAINAKDGEDVDMDKLKSGLNALKLGLIIQMACFVVFGFLVSRFAFVVRPWLKNRARSNPQQTRGLRRLMWITVVCAILLMARGIYRVFEFSQEVDLDEHANRYLIMNEWPFWVLDALPMAAVSIGFGIFHALDVFPSNLVKFRVKKNEAAVYPMENDQTYLL